MTCAKTSLRPPGWKKFTALALSAATIILCLLSSVRAQERVVILAPAAADVVSRLGAGDFVVGVTSSVEDFPAAESVGTHRQPEIEKIAALRPTLLIAARDFDPTLAERLGAELFIYDPADLAGITTAMRDLAARLGREKEGQTLAEYIAVLLSQTDSAPPRRPTVLYEVRAEPLSVAGSRTVIRDLLEKAGFEYAHKGSSGLISAEYLLAHQPDYYIYQIGPMNKNPVPPNKRPGWENLKSHIWKVDELKFARPNIAMFETLVELSKVLRGSGDHKGLAP